MPALCDVHAHCFDVSFGGEVVQNPMPCENVRTLVRLGSNLIIAAVMNASFVRGVTAKLVKQKIGVKDIDSHRRVGMR